MNTDLNLSSTFLAKGNLRRIEDGTGTLVSCLGGTLWLTQEGDPRDVILQAGDEAIIDRDGASYLSALADARFVLSQADALQSLTARPAARHGLRIEA
jgi:hypothetical protein